MAIAMAVLVIGSPTNNVVAPILVAVLELMQIVMRNVINYVRTCNVAT